MKRRPMTAEERQFRLPIPRPSDSAPVASSGHPDERPTAPVSMGTPKTCITCGALRAGKATICPKPARPAPRRITAKRITGTPFVNAVPASTLTPREHAACAGVRAERGRSPRGDTDAWEWKDEEAADSAVRSDDAQELAQEEGGEEAQEELSGESEDEDSTVASAEEVAPGEGDTESDQTEEN